MLAEIGELGVTGLGHLMWLLDWRLVAAPLMVNWWLGVLLPTGQLSKTW